MLQELFAKDITFIKSVGPRRAELLQTELHIFTVRDLLEHYPLRYEDRSRFYTISELRSDMPSVQCVGTVSRVRELQSKNGKKYLTADFSDESGRISLVWFKAVSFAKKTVKEGERYVLFGSPQVFNRSLSVAHPELIPEDVHKKNQQRTLLPIYPSTQKLTQQHFNSKAFQKILSHIFSEFTESLPETLPGYLVRKLKLLPYGKALREIHFPENISMMKQARLRLKFEELFYLQLHILRQYKGEKEAPQGHLFPLVGEKFSGLYESLPFSLTGAQKKVIKEIRKDFKSGLQSNRLLQGDVGSGKTLVATLLMLIAADNDFQSCLMAPTEILAKQHYDTLCSFLKGQNVRVDLLTGSTKESARRILLDDLQKGEIDILIGTHALIEDRVVFQNLALVVIDEQHRFGVAQRAKLWKKNVISPHVVVMTATPIPRTLAMTVYGDLDVSVIDELPPGRKPVKTFHVFENQRRSVIRFLQKEIEKGQQVYVVYPLIQESEAFDYKNLEEGVKILRQEFGSAPYEMSVVHGQMKPDAKEEAMRRFASGESHIMVATTVIEVGVNVPNASVMLIESAERFGLSQLHQLRGRVGRGADQSYCILMTDYKLSADARTRMETMVGTNDGFVIAEADMRLRGPGDMQSTRQSGIPFQLKLTDLSKDIPILETARQFAKKILKEDPDLEDPLHSIIQSELKRRHSQAQGWSNIS